MAPSTYPGSDESRIRQANADDLEQLWLLWKQVMDQKIYFPHDESCSRESIEKSWINLNNQMYVVDADVSISNGNTGGIGSGKIKSGPVGKLAGAYILKPNQPGYGSHIANASYMVEQEFRGHGLGKLMCAHSIEQAKQAGYRGIQFNLVVSTNIEAVKAWQTNGFEIIGTVPGGFYHVEKGYVDAHIFFLDLTK